LIGSGLDLSELDVQSSMFFELWISVEFLFSDFGFPRMLKLGGKFVISH